VLDSIYTKDTRLLESPLKHLRDEPGIRFEVPIAEDVKRATPEDASVVERLDPRHQIGAAAAQAGPARPFEVRFDLDGRPNFVRVAGGRALQEGCGQGVRRRWQAVRQAAVVDRLPAPRQPDEGMGAVVLLRVEEGVVDERGGLEVEVDVELAGEGDERLGCVGREGGDDVAVGGEELEEGLGGQVGGEGYRPWSDPRLTDGSVEGLHLVLGARRIKWSKFRASKSNRAGPWMASRKVKAKDRSVRLANNFEKSSRAVLPSVTTRTRSPVQDLAFVQVGSSSRGKARSQIIESSQLRRWLLSAYQCQSCKK
jgi:hypothetical protein